MTPSKTKEQFVTGHRIGVESRWIHFLHYRHKYHRPTRLSPASRLTRHLVGCLTNFVTLTVSVIMHSFYIIFEKNLVSVQRTWNLTSVLSSKSTIFPFTMSMCTVRFVAGFPVFYWFILVPLLIFVGIRKCSGLTYFTVLLQHFLYLPSFCFFLGRWFIWDSLFLFFVQ